MTTHAASIPLRCRCGQVQGVIGTGNTYVRATCYCKDCRAFAQWLGAGAVVDAAFGLVGRCVINTESATAPVQKKPVAFALGGLRIVLGILGAKLRGVRMSPFYDVSLGRAQCEVVRPEA